MHMSLEEELRLPSSDLRSHGWYHGPIGRAAAESLLQEDGQFLVRDCLSQPDDFVLSCQHAGGRLHFIINRVYILPNTLYERVQYQLEDDLFDTIADLVTFYVGNKQPITQRSGAHISRPVIRTVRLGLGEELPPPPKPEKIYCNTGREERRSLRKEYYKFKFRPVDTQLGQLDFAGVEFSNSGINEAALRSVQAEIRDTGVRILSRALTLVNMRLLRLDRTDVGNGNESDLGLGVMTGLELLSLPQGDTLRATLVERAHYLKLLVVASLLLTDESDLALVILTKWIQVALEVKAALGDLFGFQCIMMGLMAPPVAQLKSLWLSLRQRNTELALLFETKLRQEVTALLDRCDNAAPNTCIPNIYFYISVAHQFAEGADRIQLEKIGPDFGLATLLAHLENIRSVASQTERYHKSALCVVSASDTPTKSYPFFETENLIALFNTEAYQSMDGRERANRVTVLLDQLSKRSDGCTQAGFPHQRMDKVDDIIKCARFVSTVWTSSFEEKRLPNQQLFTALWRSVTDLVTVDPF
ncbi:SH2 domain-containing protein 3C-like [Tropilaelaps mercedesae]|uniref:SH2 domain-containing protein 3C-like n=1 Tax=Tropilaelaps mercedesae TaxID=418985 RepID=A0A1V9XRT0_9ACAR|nr:SH2 domain-containing protein 3C-like [Tropilaelaps mercedesae]